MTMITPSYLGETIEYSSLHACRSTLEDPTIRTLKAAELSARYEALGGKTGEGDRGVRKGGSRWDRYIPLDPEFVDAGDDIDEGTVSLDGSRTRVWAPFILIGC